MQRQRMPNGRHPNWGHPDHDACGTGFVARLGGPAGYDIILFALTALERLTHRGGVDADGACGDGAAGKGRRRSGRQSNLDQCWVPCAYMDGFRRWPLLVAHPLCLRLAYHGRIRSRCPDLCSPARRQWRLSR